VRVVGAEDIARALTYPALIAALREAFRADITVPVRHHHTIAQPGTDATLLLMPAWTNGPGERFLGCKAVTVFPDNVTSGLPSLYGSYQLMSGDTGAPLAVMDGRVLTAWRTAAASALAASFLARADASHLVMIGAGALAPHLVRAHASVRPIRRVTLWNRTFARAEEVANMLSGDGFELSVAESLDDAVREADIVSCATLATAPLVKGAWLKDGAHLDLVGSFRPHMREADDTAVTRARLYVDARAALREAGDLSYPLAHGIIREQDIQGDLFELCRGTAPGRSAAGRGAASEITLFKSVGNAIEDLAAAMLVWRTLSPHI
jgi:alanine dehydrogenase